MNHGMMLDTAKSKENDVFYLLKQIGHKKPTP